MKKINKKGFTLIEVVLVLAIGGLIFLLAFLAFQQVSANRRDTQRRSDAGRVIAELQNYKSDSGKNIVSSALTGGSSVANTGICATSPGAFQDFAKQYLCANGFFLSPSGSNYNSVKFDDTTTVPKDSVRITTTFTVFGSSLVAKDCSGNDLPEGAYRVEIGLEKGTACRDSK